MKTASISQLKSELGALSPTELRDLCLKLARYKAENKDMLTYLLFYKGNESEYLTTVKAEIDLLFSEINTSHLYFARKSIRKILRVTNRYIRFSGNKQTEVELRLYFCSKLRHSGLLMESGSSLGNIFEGQMQKIRKCLASLHEDLQHDYRIDIEMLGLS